MAVVRLGGSGASEAVAANRACASDWGVRPRANPGKHIVSAQEKDSANEKLYGGTRDLGHSGDHCPDGQKESHRGR